MEDNHFTAKIATAIDNKCTKIFVNSSVYNPPTLFLVVNHNQQNILNNISASNNHCGNFNYDNSNRSGSGVVRGYPREVKNKHIIGRTKYYINQSAVLKASK